MATIGGADFTNFRNVRVRGTVGNSSSAPGALRVVATNALESTLSVNTTYQDNSYQWTLPAKSGGIPIMGTFTLHLPAVSAGSYYETAVVISGIRAEDAFFASLMTPNETITTNRGRVFYNGASISNSGVTMLFFNPTATATVYGAHTVAYVAFR